MIVVDTSALFAVFLKEEEAPSFLKIMKQNDLCLSAATRFETHLVAMRSYPFIPSPAIDAFLTEMEVAIMPVDNRHIDSAISAYRRFGKGRHKAGLNFGDCFAYALAKEQNAPLLFKGEDFAQTDSLVARG